LSEIKKKEAHLDFDPRKFRLKYGIRGYVEQGSKTKAEFSGKGVRLGWLNFIWFQLS
jgi:hypothetical protein